MDTKHCVSVNIAKRLVTSGWNKPTIYGWKLEPKLIEGGVIEEYVFRFYVNDVTLPAPLATEILEELPTSIESKTQEKEFLIITKENQGEYLVRYNTHNKYADWMSKFQNKSLPDALAEMWMYLRQ